MSRATFIAMLTVVAVASVCRGQTVGPGSTVQGDILRGEGVFLQGLAWYELNEAKAVALNFETSRRMMEWQMQVYNAYTHDRAARIQARRNATYHQAEEAQRRYEERETRLRTNPSAAEVLSGDALNALLVDLSDPSIADSSWRAAKISLPAELSIHNLVFRFAPKAGNKSSRALSAGIIALSRLDVKAWPIFLQLQELTPERTAYEAAYNIMREKSLAGALDLESVLALDKAVERLKARASVAVPADRGFRQAASQWLADLKRATRMFNADTIDYAEEMIGDTHRHEAQSIRELLAFMQKYRLMFADSEPVLGGADIYQKLYRLLREQREALGIKQVAPRVQAAGFALPKPGEHRALNAQARRFAGTTWDMIRITGPKREPIYRIVLGRDGVILGALHPNESQWDVQGNDLIFRDANGQASTIFSELANEDGKLVLFGKFRNGKFAHGLIEVKR